MYKSNKFCDILGIGKGVTAIIGSGGKTSLMMRLAEELAERGRMIVCTSTHIMRPENMPVIESDGSEDLGKLIGSGKGPVCVGTSAENGKLTAPKKSFEELAKAADHVLVEADGAKRLPLKCHAPHEPVIPENAGRVILVIGLSGIGKKACGAVHRPELFEQLTGLGPEDTVTAQALAKAVAAEVGRFTNPAGNEKDPHGRELIVFINQADTDEDLEQARELARELKSAFAAEYRDGSGASESQPAAPEIFAGSIQNGNIIAIDY